MGFHKYLAAMLVWKIGPAQASWPGIQGGMAVPPPLSTIWTAPVSTLHPFSTPTTAVDE